MYVELNFPAIVTQEFAALFDRADITKNIEYIFQNNFGAKCKSQ